MFIGRLNEKKINRGSAEPGFAFALGVYGPRVFHPPMAKGEYGGGLQTRPITRISFSFSNHGGVKQAMSHMQGVKMVNK